MPHQLIDMSQSATAAPTTPYTNIGPCLAFESLLLHPQVLVNVKMKNKK
jgi:hypothetical protein